MLADKLDVYKEKGNIYVDNNIREIQDIYKEKKTRKEEGEVILIKPYKTSKTTSSSLSA